ncbi:hypothetical protein [Streptomyces pinistramenti]|uniref:hypothetical protein n=1 Tax=Streptomyces pinistramenti TaxID=2884812 RepID=UPI001D08B8D9|nr:hypothetical protein [Streptomyces pinistramenti]MCB5905876.1 hypothetical protein [Streptomyces pinistramenti]
MPSTMDGRIEEAFGAPVGQLYEAAQEPEAPVALTRALELRSFLAVVEAHVARVRDRVHQATAADGDMDALSADDLRMDAQWMAAALSARNDQRTALGELLRTMPAPATAARRRPARFTRYKIPTTLPPAAPASPRAGAAPARRP